MIAHFTVFAVIGVAVVDIASNTRRSLEDYFSIALRHIAPLVVLGSLVAVLTGIGFLAFIVPGLYVMAQFYVLPACIVFEGSGTAALGRAQSLSSGYRWSIIGAAMILGVFILGIGLIVGAIQAPLSSGTGVSVLLGSLFNVVINALSSCVAVIFTVFLYARLREIKEGVGIEDISPV
jgi:hypothetical protein